jgi:hypothetical protein
MVCPLLHPLSCLLSHEARSGDAYGLLLACRGYIVSVHMQSRPNRRTPGFRRSKRVPSHSARRYIARRPSSTCPRPLFLGLVPCTAKPYPKYCAHPAEPLGVSGALQSYPLSVRLNSRLPAVPTAAVRGAGRIRSFGSETSFDHHLLPALSCLSTADFSGCLLFQACVLLRKCPCPFCSTPPCRWMAGARRRAQSLPSESPSVLCCPKIPTSRRPMQPTTRSMEPSRAEPSRQCLFAPRSCQPLLRSQCHYPSN